MIKLWCLRAIIEFKYLNNTWPGFLRIIASITSSLFLISKCSRITWLQSLFFQLLRIKRFVKFRSVYELFSCKQDNQGFLAFIYQVSPLAKDYDVLTRFQASQALSSRFALCAWHLGKGALSPIVRASRIASFPWRLALQNKTNTNPSLFCVQISTRLSHFWDNLIFAIPF